MAGRNGPPEKEVTQANITRVLAIGFASVILLLSVGGSVAFQHHFDP